MILLGISAAIIGIFIGCNDKKHVDAPVLGPAAGSGPVGGGDTQKITLLASPSETITVSTTEQGTVQVTALIENNIGQPMPDGTAVYWTTEIGTLDSTVTTSSNGSSTVTLTFPKGHNGCTWVVARSGDVEGGIRLCVTSVAPTATPTPGPTATPAPAPPAATPTPTRTIIIYTNPTPPTISDGNTIDIWAFVATNSVPDTNVTVTFTAYGPVLGEGLYDAATLTTTTLSAISGASGFTPPVTFQGINSGLVDQMVTVTATTADGRSTFVIVTVQP